jgi:membrane protein
MWTVFRATWQNFSADECPRLAAAVAYYTFFALPALVVALVFVAGTLIQDQYAATLQLHEQLVETIGETGAEQVRMMLENASRRQKSWSGWLIGMGMLLLGATGALTELQTALNRAWGVKPKTGGVVRQLLTKRLLSLALLVTIAVLLIVSMAASWALAAFGQWLDGQQLGWLPSQTMRLLHMALSLLIYSLLFAALLHFLPDARVPWSDGWMGAAATAVLFWAGQWGLSVYLGWSKPTSAYGAAGSLALVLLWIYYSSLIFLLGAEFTQALAERRGKHAAPVKGAREETRHHSAAASQAP